jgi:Serine carboxypeptidase
VQSALGTPLNWSQSIDSVYYAFSNLGDYARSDMLGYLEDIAYVLDSGIKVALVYGDSDYACSWVGGEEVSLAIDYTGSDQFRSAGYTAIQTNSSYVGGQVRQYGNFSFSRVYGKLQDEDILTRSRLTKTDAGHEIPSYQPETSYEIFMRAMTNRDIATGNVSTTDDPNYSTTGTSSTWQIKNEVPDSPAPTCYVRALRASCTDDQIESVLNGTALIQDWIVVDNNTSTLADGTTGDGTSSGDRPSGSAGSESPSSSSTGTSNGGATPSTTATGEGVELEIQLSSMALIFAIAIAVVL